MAGKITFECPACFAKLNVSDPSKLGKKIKCPKCQEIFAPEPIDDDDLEDEDDEPKSPSSRKKAGGGSKGSSKKGGKGKAAEGSNTLLILGGVLALLLVVGGGLYFSGVFGVTPVAAPVSTAPMQTPTMPPGNMAGAHSAPPNPAAAHSMAANPAAAHSMAANPAAAHSMAANPGAAHSAAANPGAAHSAGARTAAAPPTPKTTEMTAAEKTLGLRWFPQETDLIIQVKLSDIWQAPLLKGPLSDPSAKASFKEFEKFFGVGPADIETVTVGVVDLMGSFVKIAANAPASRPGVVPPMFGPQDNRALVVVKSKKPIDLKQIATATPNAKMQERSGKSYLEIPSPIPGGESQGAWSPEPNTLISGTSKELFAAMDRGETVVPRKEFATIDAMPQLVIAAAVRSTTAEEKKLFDDRQKEFPDLVKQAMKTNEDLGLQLLQLGLTIKGGFDLKVAVACRTAEGASKLKALADEFVNQAKGAFAVYEKTAPPLLAELGQTLISKLTVTTTNEIVSASTGIPDSDQAKLEQLPAIVMMMAMTGGFNNLGGPPGGGGFAGGLMKPFGETDGVDAVKSEGLPDGMKMSAKSSWGMMPEISADGKISTTLEVLIDVTGDGLDKICGASVISATKTSLEGGGSLKKVKRTGSLDTSKGFSPFDPEELILDHPPQTLRVKVEVEAPASGATKIDVLEGSFKYLTSEDSKEFSVDEVPRKYKRPITANDPEMKPFEVKWRRGPTGENPETLSLSCAKEHLLGRVVGNPGNNMSITEVDKDQTVQKLVSLNDGGKFPDDFQIKFTVHPNVKEHTVTFRFENVPLPTPDSKPH